jgi:hypothetical protein
MGGKILKTGKQVRPKTAPRGKRYKCAVCHKRSPTPVVGPAPWYCPSHGPETRSKLRGD